ncbi:hypothetical protein D3C72_1904160 [compost metagenome]
MVGHAVVIGARARGHHNAPRLGVGHGDVLVACAQRANQRERGQCIDLRRAQAHGTDGQHRPHAGAVLRNGSGGLRCVGSVDHFEGLGHLGDVLFRQKHEGKQNGLHSATGRDKTGVQTSEQSRLASGGRDGRDRPLKRHPAQAGHGG